MLKTTYNGPKWILTTKLADLTGYSEKALNLKMDTGVWKFNKIWRNAPDGRRQINVVEYEKWVEQEKK